MGGGSGDARLAAAQPVGQRRGDPRPADYIGYLVAARIQQGRPLRDLARLKGAELRRQIDAALADPAVLLAEAIPARDQQM